MNALQALRPTFSIVTPSYNQGAFIGRTIESVLNQGIADLEYLILDGGSTDNTVDILKSFGRKIHWVSEKDRGQADAVNKGLVQSTGALIGWLNSDDVYFPGALRVVQDYFQQHPDVDIVYGGGDHIDENDQFIEHYPIRLWNPKMLPRGCYICQPAVFFRREVFEKVGLLNDSLHYCMDYEYWLRVADSALKVGVIDRVLAGSRLHGQTKTLGARAKAHAEINEMLRSRYGRVPVRWILNFACVAARVDRKVDHRAFWRYPSFALELLRAAKRWGSPLSAPFLFEMCAAFSAKLYDVIAGNAERRFAAGVGEHRNV